MLTTLKGIATLATVLILGKLVLNAIPGELRGRDIASVIWVILLITCFFVAGLAVRWIGKIYPSQRNYISLGGVLIAFLSGFIIHGWQSQGDFVTEIIGTLIGLLLIWVIMISQIKMDEISVRVWKKEDGYTTDIIWKTLSNQLILRQRVGDIVLSDARTMNEAALKAAIFIGYYDLSPNLKSKIDAAFKTYPVPELKKSREYILLLGISLTTLVVVVLMWSLAGAMSFIFGLLSYFVIFFNAGKWALRRSKLALYMTTDFERLHLASYIFEESYNFFKSNVWLQILSPFTLVKPKQQMHADLFLAATTFMYMHQPYEALKRYEQVLEEFPNEPETTWLVNVIKHIGVSPQVD